MRTTPTSISSASSTSATVSPNSLSRRASLTATTVSQQPSRKHGRRGSQGLLAAAAPSRCGSIGAPTPHFVSRGRGVAAAKMATTRPLIAG